MPRKHAPKKNKKRESPIVPETANKRDATTPGDGKRKEKKEMIPASAYQTQKRKEGNGLGRKKKKEIARLFLSTKRGW